MWWYCHLHLPLLYRWCALHENWLPNYAQPEKIKQRKNKTKRPICKIWLIWLVPLYSTFSNWEETAWLDYEAHVFLSVYAKTHDMRSIDKISETLSPAKRFQMRTLRWKWGKKQQILYVKKLSRPHQTGGVWERRPGRFSVQGIITLKTELFENNAVPINMGLSWTCFSQKQISSKMTAERCLFTLKFTLCRKCSGYGGLRCCCF